MSFVFLIFELILLRSITYLFFWLLCLILWQSRGVLPADNFYSDDAFAFFFFSFCIRTVAIFFCICTSRSCSVSNFFVLLKEAPTPPGRVCSGPVRPSNKPPKIVQIHQKYTKQKPDGASLFNCTNERNVCSRKHIIYVFESTVGFMFSKAQYLCFRTHIVHVPLCTN